MERAGARPHVLTTDPGDPGAAEALRSRGWGLDVVAEPAGSIRDRAAQLSAGLPSPYLREIQRRVGELVAEDCAFVQVEHTQSAYYAHAFGDVPWVLSLHNVDSTMMGTVARTEPLLSLRRARAMNRTRTLRRVERLAVPEADGVICVSERDRTSLAGVPKRVVVAPNGVDEDLFDVPAGPLTADRVLFFGQLNYLPNDHGIRRFLREGWAEVLARRPAARLRVAGGGMGPELRAEIEAASRVEALGFVDDLGEELAASSCVVVPIWAGGGTRLKVLEALAAGRPVAGTPLGVEGLGFVHGRHGMVSETPSGLAAATAELLDRSSWASKLGADGRRLAGGYRWRSALEPAERLYRGFIERQRDRTSVQP
jgi:glycosyltransferase involved in cell wall biosynthesis